MSLAFLKDVPEFKALVRELEEGRRGLRISGLADAAKPFFLSVLADALPKTLIIIQPAEFSLARFEEQSLFFLTHLGSSKRAKALPPLTEEPFQDAPPSLEAVSSRMRFFYDLLHRRPSLVVTNLFGLLRPFPAPADLPGLFLRLERGALHDRDRFLRTLTEFGYVREDLISFRGEYAGRGGIVDVFPPWQNAPYRLEFSGDEIASIREFDPSTQRSLRRLNSALIPSLLESAGPAGASVSFTAYLDDPVFIIDHAEDVAKEWDEAHGDPRSEDDQSIDRSPASLWPEIRERAVLCEAFESGGTEPEFHFPFQSVPRFDNKIPFFLDYVRRLQRERDRCYIFLTSPAVRNKISGLLAQNDIESREADSPLEAPRGGEILLVVGDLGRGFGFPREKISFFAESDIITEEKVVVSRPSVRPSLTQFQDLRAGDYIVHADYGIGRFNGLLRMDVDGRPREFMELHYRDDDKLFVPVEDLSLVQKYAQVGTILPPLDKLGTNTWQKTKERTKKAVEKLAKELLELYARRKALKGFGFSPEGQWQTEFEKTFEFEETEDQHRSIREIKADMEEDFPMDRLLCGDVGYGKTEVAMRAAFKAVMDGKQVAVLCPTTVLASQHMKTFSSRFVLFPVRVAELTRLQSKAEQQKIVEDVKKGLVDVIIGTHRILSADVEFFDLGLLVIDEEQRFGVKHKEKIKQMKAAIDVLTLTATPIPRTLNLSLAGLRDISLIETPPKDRLAIHTVVTTFSPKLITTAVKQELARGGQVYYIFNKIEEMEHMASLIEKWVPQARVVTLHGQMRPPELEKRMIDFIDQTYNVMVSTTIIENGIDIPLVNTLIVHRADHFGLAQLYQLRGRVGRSSRQALAYFLVPPFNELTPLAKRRLEALKEFSELGSGFRLAMKDLEIRGAGDVFGAAQHGTMEAVGFDYFVHLLERTIRELKGEIVEDVKSEINLKVDIQIPEDYLPQMNLRLNLYKRISSADTAEEIQAVEDEIKDRFGPPPQSVRNLCQYGRIKLLAQRLKIKRIDRMDGKVIFKFLPSSAAQLGRMTALFNRYAGSLTPQGVMSLALHSGRDEDFLRETIAVLKEL
ncbi:MAG: transcription-repair coupling factor [Candidatus Aminicenantes bacterium]|nr:transcription-repair coupling factor [Candidatus Aminicenantes bacterium]